ncbi:predicted protein [Streptomyces viridochromogenes DSM 40736]|uniref:Predicted protein n=1 Tax=Streptomyces viridochromogenes (strain DSM 40736 / JCM 4977 / BCRC 1201 / Tue 494) TaxID=591159 RepID=D9X1K6_STRVT|nr:predicted protein [Streptomyces viridochromogenes DSM 40736]
MLYTVWQNSSTPDTYYSCSDVVFPEGEQKETRKETQKGTEEGTQKETEEETEQKADQQRGGVRSKAPLASTSDPSSGPSTPMLAGGAAAVLVLTGGAALAVRLRRR